MASSSTPGQVIGDDLWTHVTIIRRPSEGGGNLRWRCNFCQKEYTRSLTRLKDHLLKITGCGIAICAKISPIQLRKVQQFVDEAALRAKSSRARNVHLPPSVGSSSHPHPGPSSGGVGPSVPYNEQRKMRATNNPIANAFNTSERQKLDALIARAFYSAALSFNLARNPYFQEAFTYATNKAKSISGYKILGYNALRTTLLQNQRGNIQRLLEATKFTWVTKGATIVCDGWTDSQRRSLINFIVINEGGPMFLKAVNCEGEYKDKFFITDLIKEVVFDVGPRNVVQVITDNAPILLVESQYPKVFWTPCVVHTLNLALKNICAPKNTPANEKAYSLCSWIIDVVGDGVLINNFIMNHSMKLHMFNEHSRLKLLSIAETRFASSIIMLKRLKDIKSSIQSMVIGDQWDSYKEDDVEKTRIVKGKLLDDLWWDKVDYVLRFTEPIYLMLRRADTDKSCLHLVYEMWDVMIEKVKQVIYGHEGKENSEESEFFSVVHQILVDRWEKNNTPLHCLEHSLNPRYYSREWLEDDPNRISPHRDPEITKERDKCFKRYFPNIEEKRLVITEYARFSTGTGQFAEGDALQNRAYLEPDVWWVSHGTCAPLLLNIALKLLRQPCSSSCCERNWSTYNNIHSLKRNKLTPQRTEDLVYVHSNLHLLSKRKQEYKEGETMMWDIAGDTIDSLDLDATGMLEIVSLSLDEPELEAELLNEENATIDPPVNEEEEM